MSSAVYPIPDGPRNVLQMTHNILATENVTLTQLWATTPVPTTPPVSASVMLVAPQHCGHFPWFLVKSLIINFVRSLQPTPVEHDLHMFALTWADRANAVQFSVETKTFLLFFCDSAMFWCFKYMVHCRDQVDRHRHHVPELNAKVLLDAFLDFKIPMEVPLGVRSTVQGFASFATITFSWAELSFTVLKSANSMQTPPVAALQITMIKEFQCRLTKGNLQFRYALDHNHRQVNTVVSMRMLREGEYTSCSIISNTEISLNRLDIPQCQSTATDDCPGGMGERTPGPTVSDMRPAAHTSRSHSIVMGDDAGGTSGSVQPAVDALPYLSADSPTNQWADRCSQLLDPINSGEGGTADCDLTVRQKKRKLM
ncbi:hypothetical protein EDD17DRAFT_1756958 [Pisolithus thermaeus]|nr:hypothetical protein EDD17DRAFT_1756958 [Pisolithus thermaeus]